MSDISMGIEHGLSAFRLDVNGALAICFAVVGIAAHLTAAAFGLVIA